jgi:two-component system cell cycle sensor histidine kinase/response regulator CckA
MTDAANVRQNPGSVQNPAPPSGTVLLVDDELMIRRLGARILEKAGYRVIIAGDGAEGVDIYRQRAAEIDVTILDMNMPGMDGVETMTRLKAEFPNIKVLISTGHSMDGELKRMQCEGTFGLLQKPYRADDLREKVREAMANVKA